MSTWTLESELCNHAGVDDLAEALQKLGMLTIGEESFTLRCDTDWSRGGAETFIFRFWIDSPTWGERGYIIKACVSMSFGRSVSEIVNLWIIRRDLLKAHGIATPKLLSHIDGVLIEELIPLQLRSLMLLDGALQIHLIHSIAQFAGVVSRLGFAPVNLISDLRSRGNDLVVIDFGEDLGPPDTTGQQTVDCFQLMITELKSWSLPLEEGLIRDLRRTYSKSLHFE